MKNLKLKVARVAKDLSQEELANLVGVTRQTINMIEKGNYNPFIFGGEKAVSEAKSALFLTTAELFDDLELLELDKYKEIVENTIGLGLKAEVERIINKKGGDKNGKSI